jgi:hypothetical protein
MYAHMLLLGHVILNNNLDPSCMAGSVQFSSVSMRAILTILTAVVVGVCASAKDHRHHNEKAALTLPVSLLPSSFPLPDLNLPPFCLLQEGSLH